jgi:NitT/TauT family transport system substrate-binding protein
MMRQGKMLFAGALATFLLPAAGASAQPTKIVVGRSVSSDALPVVLADEQGFFAKRGLDVKVIIIPVPSNIGPLLVSGSIQIGGGTPIGMLQGVEAGLPFKVVAGGTRFSADNPTAGLVTRIGVKVEKPADLIGKKVAVPGLNSGNYMLMLKWLKNADVPANKVTFLEAPLPQMGDMLKSGNIDAAVINDPNRARVASSGNGTLSVPYMTEVNPDAVNIFWMANAKWADENQSAVHSFREALNDAIKFIKENPEKARDLEIKMLGSASPRLPTYNVDMKPQDIDFFIALGRELGVLEKAHDTSTLIAK